LSKHEIELIFYKIYKKEMKVSEFESWLYSIDEKDIDEHFGEGFYLELASVNYKDKYAVFELEKLIYNKIPFGKYEADNLKFLLNGIIQGTLDLVEVLGIMYELYCDGFTFLRYIGLAYILNGIDDLPRLRDKMNWNEEAFINKRVALDSIESKLVLEAKRILSFIESGKIIITGELEYDDFRSSDEKIELHSYETMHID